MIIIENWILKDINKQNVSFRRQRLDIDNMLPPAVKNLWNTPDINDPYIIDMIKLADERITQLQSELNEMIKSKEAIETKSTNLKSQVS